MASKTGIRQYNTKNGKRVKIYRYHSSRYSRKKILLRKSTKGIKSTLARTLVISSNGRIYKRGLKMFIDREVHKGYKAGEIPSKAAEENYRRVLKEVVKDYAAHNKGRTMSVLKMSAHTTTNRISTYLANMGLTPEDAALEIGTTVDAILNPVCWKAIKGTQESIFIDPNTGKQYVSRFNYTGSCFEKADDDTFGVNEVK